VPAEKKAETGESAGDETAPREIGLSTDEAASLLGIRREELYALFYSQRRLFRVERGKGWRLRWTPPALETARALLRRRRTAALASQTGATTAEVAAQLGLDAERVRALRHQHRIAVSRGTRGRLAWQPEAVRRLQEAAAEPTRRRGDGPREGLGTREVAALTGITPARVLALVNRFAELLAVRKDADGLYSWSTENVASLRNLLVRLSSRPVRWTTHEVATLLGVPYLRLMNLLRHRRAKIPLVRRAGLLDWTPEAIAQMREVVRRWRASAKDDQPLPQDAVIRWLPGREFLLAAPLPVLLFSSRKLGVTARLADVDCEAQGGHPREAVARLRRLLPLRYRELAERPLQEPALWAGLRSLLVPRAANPKKGREGPVG